jgi:hypothetical protein
MNVTSQLLEAYMLTSKFWFSIKVEVTIVRGIYVDFQIMILHKSGDVTIVRGIYVDIQIMSLHKNWDVIIIRGI